MCKFHFSLEGLPGAGKTTTLRRLKQNHPELVFIDEPNVKFKNFETFDPLNLFYSNPIEYCSTVQSYIIDVIRNHYTVCLENVSTHVLSERSMYSPVIFSSAQKSMGYLNDFQHKYLLHKTKSGINNIGGNQFGITHLIFLNADPKVCIQRVKTRSKVNGEANLEDIDSYFKKLHKEYVEYFYDFANRCGDSKVIMIDTVRHTEQQVFETVENFILRNTRYNDHDAS